MGIVAEALTTALLLNPCIVSHNNDRSLGKIAEEYQALKESIHSNSFLQNIKLLTKLNIVSKETAEQLQEIRLSIRNHVHIQDVVLLKHTRTLYMYIYTQHIIVAHCSF